MAFSLLRRWVACCWFCCFCCSIAARASLVRCACCWEALSWRAATRILLHLLVPAAGKLQEQRRSVQHRAGVVRGEQVRDGGRVAVLVTLGGDLRDRPLQLLELCLVGGDLLVHRRELRARLAHLLRDLVVLLVGLVELRGVLVHLRLHLGDGRLWRCSGRHRVGAQAKDSQNAHRDRDTRSKPGLAARKRHTHEFRHAPSPTSGRGRGPVRGPKVLYSLAGLADSDRPAPHMRGQLSGATGRRR